MIEIIKRFFTDPTFFARGCKALFYAAAIAVGTGQIPELPPWVGALIAGLGAIIKTGDKNPEEITSMTKEDLEALRQLVAAHREGVSAK